MKLKFYGTRGSAPVEGSNYRRYGGATTCCYLVSGNTQIMIDAGTGVTSAIREIDTSGELHLLITHSHLDHICGIAPLVSAFASGTVHIYGKTRDGLTIYDQLAGLMNPPYWPIDIEYFDNVVFHEINDDPFDINGISVRTMESNHPNGATLYRIDADGNDGSTVFAFDYNHADGYGKKLEEFSYGADVLVYDGGMTEEEYGIHPTWGHSTVSAGINIAKNSGSRLIITHHSTDITDIELYFAEKKVAKECEDVVFASDGMDIDISNGEINVTSAFERERDVLGCLLEVGTMLSSERDPDVLLEKIIRAAMYITGSDGGTVYLFDNNALYFKIMITQSKDFFKGGKGDPIDLPPVPLKNENVCASAVIKHELINISDVYNDDCYDFTGTRRYDELNGYRTKSILAIPMVDDRGEVIGVMQLINATDSNGNVVAFSKDDEKILSSIASQTAISITNANYSKQVSELLNGFVKVMSTGIDARSPYNANHTRNMVKYGEAFLEYEKETGGKWTVDDKIRKEILMSVWLHDIGKLITPLEIMDKSTRLGESLENVENRFRRILLLNRLDRAEGKVSEEEYEQKNESIKNDLEFIRSLNTSGFLPDEKMLLLDGIKAKSFTDDDGTEQPYITDTEYTQLSIKKGTLTADERTVMQGHVTMTSKMLSELDFPKDFSEVPLWAGSHHELLNGFGYPNKLKADEIPWQVRFITILDIFEALTARDRPYKAPMPVEKALDILDSMVKDGQIDAEILEEFKKSRAWEK